MHTAVQMKPLFFSLSLQALTPPPPPALPQTYPHAETVVRSTLWLRDARLCDVEAERLPFQKINIAGLSQSNTHLPADRLIIFPPSDDSWESFP